MADNPFISLVIPAYNEEERIESSLAYACKYLKEHDFTYEIIVVDDGSTDKTLEVAKNYKDHIKVISQTVNKGKGAAVRRGMLESAGTYRIFADADFSTPLKEMHKLLERLQKGVDICIGSRAVDPSMIKKHQPFYREFLGKSFNKAVQILLVKGIKDTQCGFKGFTAHAAEVVFSKAKLDGFSFDVEILYLGTKAGFKIEEVPVEWYNDFRSTVTAKKSLQALLDLFKIKRLHRKN